MDYRRTDASLCDSLIDYMLGEGSEVERKRFERHLAECPACRADAADWDAAWNELHRDMEELEPPPDLKLQLFQSLDKAEALPPEPHAAESSSAKRGFRRFGPWAAAIVIALVFSAGWWGSDAFRKPQSAALPSELPVDRIEWGYHLIADQTDSQFYRNAYGVACIVGSDFDASKQLIVYVFGAPETTGKEVYQVWLWKDGIRSSAGSFKVESSGVGLLTLPLGEKPASIQSVSVTLEPNGSSEAPQGPRVFASSSEAFGWEK